jgi:hypothetical protein
VTTYLAINYLKSLSEIEALPNPESQQKGKKQNKYKGSTTPEKA